MFFRTFAVTCLLTLRSVLANNYDHIDDFLKGKNSSEVFEFAHQLQATMYQEKHKKMLSDSAAPQLVLSYATTCDSGWTYYASTGCCYKLSDAKSTWFGGEDVCKSLNPCSHLTSLHSQAESKFVADLSMDIHAWTGLSQTEVDNTYTYTDGTPDWHWFFAESSSMTKESSCVEMMEGLMAALFNLFAQNGQTQPYNCHEEIQSICKYCPDKACATTSTTTITTPTTTTTPIIITSTTVTTKAPTTTTTAVTTKTSPSTTKTITTTKTTKTTTTTKKSTVTPPYTCTSKCVDPTVEFKGSCLKMCSGSVNFANSCEWCNGTMISISNKEENDFVARVFGANDGERRKIFIANPDTDNVLDWGAGQPYRQNTQNDYCVAMDLSAGPNRGKHSLVLCETVKEVAHSLCVQ